VLSGRVGAERDDRVRSRHAVIEQPRLPAARERHPDHPKILRYRGELPQVRGTEQDHAEGPAVGSEPHLSCARPAPPAAPSRSRPLPRSAWLTSTALVPDPFGCSPPGLSGWLATASRPIRLPAGKPPDAPIRRPGSALSGPPDAPFRATGGVQLSYRMRPPGRPRCVR
jgi:hypothetical protein